MPTFPVTLPTPMIAGYGVTPYDQTARTEMETGPARVRRRSAARNDRITVQWRFTDAEMAAFRTWFDSPADAAGGSAWFTIGLATGDGGIVSQDARFVNGFKDAKPSAGLNWLVTATLETR